RMRDPHPRTSRRTVRITSGNYVRDNNAVFVPATIRAVRRPPPGLVPSQQLEPGFDGIPTLSTRSRRFTHVRLPSTHLTGLVPPFPRTLTTEAIGPRQLRVV